MRIVVDLQGAQTESRFRGIGRNSLTLSKEFAKLAASHDLWLLLNQNLPDAIDKIKSEFKDILPENHILTFITPVPVAGSIVFNNQWRTRTAELLREALIANLNPDIVYITSLFEGWVDNAVTSVGTFDTDSPTAISLYDLIPLLNSDTYLTTQLERDYYYRKIGSLKKANLLLSNSEYTRQEGIRILSFPEEKIVNASSAADEIFKKNDLSSQEIQSLLSRFKIRLPFIMYSGGFDSRKNIKGLFEAYSLLPDQVRDQYHLVVVGKSSPGEQDLLNNLGKKYGITDSINWVGYVSDQDLAKLYNLCSLFVFPSFNEGFGLPPLEAMACGAPVIGSNTTSLPEVINCKEALFDPNNVSSITEKITQVLWNANFSLYLRNHGLQQSGNFSWKESARRVLDAFEALYAQENKKSDFFIAVDKSYYKKLIKSITSISKSPEEVSNNDLILTAQSIYENEKTVDRALRSKKLNEKINWQVEGTFHDNYSLSLVNRETACALHKLGHQVSIKSSNAPGFYMPTKEVLDRFFIENPDIEPLYRRLNETEQPISADRVISRNIYPPFVSDMDGRINLLHQYAWEETGFPADYVTDFNKHLQGIACTSAFVEKILIDNGVNIPLSISGVGVDHWERIKPDTKYKMDANKFRLLHISSCFPRKGVDILLDAYGELFKDTSDVSLIIKTFKNPHNHIHEMVSEQKRKNSHYPHVLIIEEELTDAQLKSLCEQCQALVGPSRGEGFGLPFAEAILSGLPVITTGWGGQSDFCNTETAWLVDYRYKQAQTHLDIPDSVWAEPNKEDLVNKIREIYESSEEERKKKVEAGRRLLLSSFRWLDVAGRLVNSVRAWSSIPPEPKPKIGWVTTWNTKCGIASYSSHLVMNLPCSVSLLAARTDILTAQDEAFVTRCWSQDGYEDKKDNLSELSQAINDQKLDTLVIQFNYAFFDLYYLNEFLNQQIDSGRIVLFVLHSTTDPISNLNRRLSILLPALNRCHRILVHSINDLNRLKDLGLVNNVMLFPHGMLEYTPGSNTQLKDELTLATYGFFLPHKGLLELIEAFAMLLKDHKKLKLLMVNAEYPDNLSANAISEARNKIDRLGISENTKLITEYLSDNESLSLLSKANLIVYPYQQTNESASGAVRYGLATGRPVAVTPLSIFDDVASAVYKLPGFDPIDIKEGVGRIMDELKRKTSNANHIEEKAKKWRTTHNYPYLSDRLYRTIQALHRKEIYARSSMNPPD